jgi:LacI family transcriptional regulator
MTVSRVINKQGLVKEATREKVQAAIDELNYRPNLSARRLAGGKSLFVGLVYHNPSPGYLTNILVGAMTACRDNAHHLVLEDLGKRAPYQEPEKVAKYLNNAGLDGVIITPPLSDHDVFIQELEKMGVAVVRIAPKNIHSQKLRVAMDDSSAAQQMLEHIIDLGHKKIGFVKGPTDHSSSEHRYKGFVQTMSAHGIEVNPDYIASGDFTYKSGINAGQHFLSLTSPPTAVFASNDDMAAGVVSAAHMKGLSVPQDLSVAGFDDTEIATHIWPELTTIKQPIIEMSVRAVDLLTAHLHGDADEVAQYSKLMDFELMQRDSVAPPK